MAFNVPFKVMAICASIILIEIVVFDRMPIADARDVRGVRCILSLKYRSDACRLVASRGVFAAQMPALILSRPKSLWACNERQSLNLAAISIGLEWHSACLAGNRLDGLDRFGAVADFENQMSSPAELLGVFLLNPTNCNRSRTPL